MHFNCLQQLVNFSGKKVSENLDDFIISYQSPKSIVTFGNML